MFTKRTMRFPTFAALMEKYAKRHGLYMPPKQWLSGKFYAGMSVEATKLALRDWNRLRAEAERISGCPDVQEVR